MLCHAANGHQALRCARCALADYFQGGSADPIRERRDLFCQRAVLRDGNERYGHAGWQRSGQAKIAFARRWAVVAGYAMTDAPGSRGYRREWIFGVGTMLTLGAWSVWSIRSWCQPVNESFCESHFLVAPARVQCTPARPNALPRGNGNCGLVEQGPATERRVVRVDADAPAAGMCIRMAHGPAGHLCRCTGC